MKKWLLCFCAVLILQMTSVVSVEATEVTQAVIMQEIEVQESEIQESEIQEPEAQEPEAQEPEVQEPEVQEPEAQEPEAQEPEVQEPEAQEPEAQEPEAQEPEEEKTEAQESEEEKEQLEEELALLAEELEDIPIIDVTVPHQGQVLLNPYKLEVNFGGMKVEEQIIGETYYIVNQSEVPVAVDVSIAGEANANSELIFVDRLSEVKNAADKKVFLYAEFQHLQSNDDDPDWDDVYCDAEHQLIITEEETTADEVIILESGNEEGASAVFRLFGAAAASPDEAWDEEDGFYINITFSFKAVLE